MQGVNCVKGEIHNVLTVLRLNPPREPGGRSGGSSSASSPTSSSSSSSHHSSSYSHYYSSDNRYGTEDNSLIRQLKDLYELLSLHSSLQELDTSSFLSPFLSVISSHTTDIFTTAAALHSVHKFLVYGLINSASLSVARGLINTVDAVTHCNFDVRDREDAEVVSMKIIEILMECLRCSAGDQLNDESVVEMVEECLAVRARHPGASKLLRRYAENALMQMVLVLFARVSEEGRGVRDVRGGKGSREGGVRRPRRSIASPTEEEDERRRRDAAGSPDLINGYDSSSSAQSSTSPRRPPLLSSVSSPSSSSSSALVPYGIPALERVFVLLVELINPTAAAGSSEHQQIEKEADRVLGLRLIRTVLETAVRLTAPTHTQPAAAATTLSHPPALCVSRAGSADWSLSCARRCHPRLGSSPLFTRPSTAERSSPLSLTLLALSLSPLSVQTGCASTSCRSRRPRTSSSSPSPFASSSISSPR